MWSGYARDDLAEYRARYPRNGNRLELDRNVRFYRNEIVCKPENIKIDDLHRDWYGDYSWLEQCHSYIQWLFPIRESGLNPQAQVLQKHEIDTMIADPSVIARVIKSFRLMLDFYGFVLQNETDGTIVRSAAYTDRFDNLNHSGHNYLRITRMLKFLGEMGLEHLKIKWLEALEREIYVTKELRNCRSSYEDYWCGTIFDDNIRAAVAERNRAQPAPEYPRWGRYSRESTVEAAAAPLPFMATNSSDDVVSQTPTTAAATATPSAESPARQHSDIPSDAPAATKAAPGAERDAADDE